MKAIELSEKQKEKLLGMCNKLFPEYIYQEFNTNVEGNWGDDILCFYNPGDIKSINIHWFEFCTTHLMRAICTRMTDKFFGFDPWDFDKAMKKSLRKCFMYDNPFHPVDYLYEQFNKKIII